MQAELEHWDGDLGAGAPGWRGLTGGVTDDGELVVILRFDGAGAAVDNDTRPATAVWRTAVERHLAGPARLQRCPIVREIKGGGSDEAGFVRVLQGRVIDARRLAALQDDVERGLAEEAHVLGVTVADHDRGGWFTEVTYFTSERAVRAAERAMPVAKAVQLGMVRSYMEGLRLYELRAPCLASPRPQAVPAG
ncbi:MAG TPA: hypothetical protein VEP73_04555 [Actinomycetota bacterium]|nr:hypothetical protein [Actinomycetota bacterium]